MSASRITAELANSTGKRLRYGNGRTTKLRRGGLNTDFMETDKPIQHEGSKPSPGAQCSAVVYSGPHYGRTHKIIRRTGNLVWVNYRGDTFAVPACDVEEIK